MSFLRDQVWFRTRDSNALHGSTETRITCVGQDTGYFLKNEGVLYC